MKKYAYLFVFVILSLTIASCQNVFGSKTEATRVYGQWLYTRENGAGIALEIREDGSYSYKEFSSREKVLFSYDGKYSLTDSRLILKGLDSEDDRYSIFAISMKTDDFGRDVLSLVPKMTARFDFVRVSTPGSSSYETPMEKLPIEGKWVNDELGTILIDRLSLKYISLDGTMYNAKIEANGEGMLTLSFDSDELSGYERVSYFVVNGSLYVIFADISPDAVIFSKSL